MKRRKPDPNEPTLFDALEAPAAPPQAAVPPPFVQGGTEGGLVAAPTAPAPDAQTLPHVPFIISTKPLEGLAPFQLADDQERALDLTTNRVISASAGTGKTHTLTALYLGLLEGRLRPGEKLMPEQAWLAAWSRGEGEGLLPAAIVAVTFTRKAAAELLDRARLALEQDIARPDLPDALREHLLKCRETLPAAQVCTIDAFCAHLLRDAGAGSPAPTHFSVLEPADATEMLREALSVAAAEMLEVGSGPYLKTIALQMGVHDRFGLVNAGAAMLNSLRAQGKEPKTLKREAPQPPEVVRSEFEEFFRRISEAQLPKSGARLQEHARARHDLTTPEQMRRVALATRVLLLTKGKPQHVYGWAEKAGLDDPFPALLSSIHTPYANAFCDFLQRGLERYTALKREAGAVDFNDLLLHARALLQQRPGVADGYRFVLIDEYQDTNPLQDEVLRRVAFKGGDESAARLAVVGDQKQSIYRFRGADVALMKKAVERGGVAPLRRNYRSRKVLIDFFNAFFRQMWHPAAPFDYSKGNVHVLQERATQLPDEWKGPAAERIQYFGKESAAQHRWRQANAIAARIRRLIEPTQGPSEIPPLVQPEVVDRETKKPRSAIRYGDVAILARSVKHIRIPLQLALSRMGIPFRMLGGVTFFTRPEVLDLINLLACVADADDNLALEGLLRSPFVLLSDGGLWRLVFGDGDKPAASLSKRLRECAQSGLNDPADTQALKRAAELLEKLRRGQGRRTAAELIDFALQQTGYLNVLAMQPNGEVAIAAVRRLIEMSRTFEARGARQLSDLVEWLKARADSEWDEPGREENPDLTPHLPVAEDAVQIGTVHSAKGLEFPIVILADMGAQHKSGSGTINYSQAAGGVGLSLGLHAEGFNNVADAIHVDAAAHEKAADNEERLRLLYVAMTRARDYLIFSGDAKHDSDEFNWAVVRNACIQAAPGQVVDVPCDHAALKDAQPAASSSPLKLDKGAAQLDEKLITAEARAALEKRIAEIAALNAPAGKLKRRDLRISVSRLANWLSCPRKEAFLAMAPEVDPTWTRAVETEREESDDAPQIKDLGTAAHAALEAIVSGERDLDGVWRRSVAAAGITEGKETQEVLASLRRLLDGKWGGALLKSSGVRHTEQPFRWRSVVDAASGSSVTIVGAIDLLQQAGDGRWNVFDYKLTSLESLSEESRLHYAWQASIYAVAAAEVLQLAPERIEPALIFLKDKDPRPVGIAELAGASAARLDGGRLRGVVQALWRSTAQLDPQQREAQRWPLSAAQPTPREMTLCKKERCAFVPLCF